MWFGVMAYSLLLTTITSQIINTWPNRKLLHYGFIEQLKDILPGIVLAIVMGVLFFLFNFLPLSEWIKLIIQIPLGSIIYIFASILFRLESFEYLKNSIKEKFIHK